VNWFGDSMDGTLARFRRIERPRYGHFVDKTTDLLNDTLFTLGLGLSPFVRFEVACLVLITYLLITGFTLVKEQVSKTVQISFGGVGPTEVRALLVIFNVCLYAVPTKIVLVLWAPLTIADVCVLAVSAAGFILFLFLVISEAQKLAVEDPPPARRTADLAERNA
jgi:archaetidylinositol phosphate synthase